ncbi:ead/Ea22-like family protein [Enterobacter hormaechei]|uniref:ead/Ea22-like family protein n=1 Tax=Enterobacter hormaechei TaxID=158836 RepID=UPI0024DE5F74|nr:ead/Ea22-like family protein [Enterobacter hormaechei]MDK2353546.1 ead/Ea22-like family protein [Enterobacter hormaechei]
MSNIDKQTLRQLAVDAKELAIIKRYTKGIEAQKKFIAVMTPATVLALLDELEAADKRNAELEDILEAEIKSWMQRYDSANNRREAAEKRIAELEASHSNLREAMVGIHNTIIGEGAYTPLAAILNASKRAYEESASAAGKGE